MHWRTASAPQARRLPGTQRGYTMARNNSAPQAAAQAAPQAATQAAQAQPATTVAAPPANPLAAVVAATLAQHATAVAATKPVVPVVHNSTLLRPVAAVHALCAAILAAAPSTTRGQLVAQCVAAGIATATARTQVQVYLKAQQAKPQAAPAA